MGKGRRSALHDTRKTRGEMDPAVLGSPGLPSEHRPESNSTVARHESFM